MAINAPISPFAPKQSPEMPKITGVRFATVRTGARDNERPDLLLVALPDETTVAGVYTRSKTRSAAVEWSAKVTKTGSARGLVVNSGNANAFTGQRGQQAVAHTAEAAANVLKCKPEDVCIGSTGVIGEPLDTSRYDEFMATLAHELQTTDWLAAATAIMTTDTYPKLASTKTTMGNQAVNIAGIAKGSGMIAPDMATMLAFVFTDAHIPAPILQQLISTHTKTTFNAITVDSDTSTSDTLIAFATGKAADNGEDPINSIDDPRLDTFSKSLHAVCHDLAMQIVKDGEGISKFIEVQVNGAQNPEAARAIALSIANSPLVKTAIAGEDANWGRVVMAVGKAGEQADRDKLAIWFGPHQVAKDGERDPGYDEDVVSQYMKSGEIILKVDVGVGTGEAKIWTCDLTHGYITINADYRS